MKILLINYRFFNSGGPEKYMFSIINKLEEKGHQVIPFSIKSTLNKESNYEQYFAEPIGDKNQTYFEEYRRTPKTFFQIIARQFYSFHVKKRLEKLINDTKPEICYLLHHYNKLSPSVIDACKKYEIPIVLRLSDFFPVCPSSLLIRNGKICESCLTHNLLKAVKYKCVKNSRAGSLIKVSAMYFHRILGIYKKIDKIVAPAKFTLTKVIPFFDEKNCIQIPTFTETHTFNNKIGDYVLFVGRIEEEKGIFDLVKAMENTKYIVKIAGKSSTGYDKEIINYIQKKGIKNIELIGHQNLEQLKILYSNANCVVVPSLCYDNMPNVALEAMSYSRPLIVSDIGSMKELVINGENGYLFEAGNLNDLKEKIIKIIEDDTEMFRISAYNRAAKIHNGELHYQSLINIFNELIQKQ
jgi:glycosyltransferase involved in cell wall biosynthesis